MTEYLVARPQELPEELCFALVEGELERLTDQIYFLGGQARPRILERLSRAGLDLHEIVASGKPAKVQKAYLDATSKDKKTTFSMSNGRAIAYSTSTNPLWQQLNESFRLEKYCNSHLMSSLHILHNDVYGSTERVFDPFMGKGGNTLAALSTKVPCYIGVEVLPENYLSAKNKIESYLMYRGKEFEMEGDQEYAIYHIDREELVQEVRIHLANSISDAAWLTGQIPRLDVIADLPRRGTSHSLDGTYEGVQQMLEGLAAQHMTLVVPKDFSLHLREDRRIVTDRPYDIVMYSSR